MDIPAEMAAEMAAARMAQVRDKIIATAATIHGTNAVLADGSDPYGPGAIAAQHSALDGAVGEYIVALAEAFGLEGNDVGP